MGIVAAGIDLDADPAGHGASTEARKHYLVVTTTNYTYGGAGGNYGSGERAALGVPPVKLARSNVDALKGFKDIAVDRANLRTLISAHVAVVSAALSGKGGTRELKIFN